VQATLTELARDTRKIVRPVIHSGKEVILTDRGRPVAKIIQYIPTRRFDNPIEARRGTVSDESILESIREDREDYAERAGHP